MNGSDGMFKYEEIVLERVSLPVGKSGKGRRGLEPGEGRPPNHGFKTHGGTCIKKMEKQRPSEAATLHQSINSLANIN